MSEPPRTAWIVEDLPHARAWVAEALLTAFPGIEIRQADSLGVALQWLESPPDIALIDLGLPDGSGTQLIDALQRRQAKTLCVVSTVFDDDAHLFPALRAGAQGYVLKDQSVDTLGDILRGILADQPPLSPSIARRLLRHFQPAHDNPQPTPEILTPRETDVLRLIAKGYTVVQVAQALSLSHHTTAGYVKDIYRKLSISSRAEATLEATRRGLVDSSAR
jgi:DNA-binding NarL/FixJ family response regulator